jgi:hypothetical protein
VMRDLGPIDYFRHLAFPTHTRRHQLSNTRSERGRASYTTSCNRYRSDDAQRKPSAKGDWGKAPLDALLVPYYSTNVDGDGVPREPPKG